MAVPLKVRLQRRRAELREVRTRLAKRSLTVLKRKRQQRRAKRQLTRAVRNRRGPFVVEAKQRKLAKAHELLDKAILGREGYVRRQQRLEKKVAFLKEKVEEDKPTPSSGASVPRASWNPSGRPVANWIIPWLEKSYAAGWRGYITSGWRDPAYSESLCRAMCGAPSCPGRCAGRSSNHSGSTYPYGAVDLTDYYTFAAVQARIGSPLRNSLGAQDPVHFSYTGN